MKIHNVSLFILSIFIALTMTHCDSPKHELADGAVFPDPENFSALVNGKQISLYTLTNKNGLRADITNYGGRLVSLFVPDKDGVFDDIVTGYHTVGEFLESGEPYFGALIGRYGNRLANAQFTLDNQVYTLEANNGPNSLHGGPGGFHNVVWDAEQTSSQSVKLTYLSPDMEEGFPGNLLVTVIYTLTDDNELHLDYAASTDKKTVLNLTAHPFFNLAGESSKSINSHMLKINADYFTPVDETLIPTGEIAQVAGTPFDFREYTSIGERVDSDHQQIIFGSGYDHNFVINREKDDSGLVLAASIYDPDSRRKMDILTTEPGVQFYGGNFLQGTEKGKRGEMYLHRTSFCLETQHFPDSPNQPGFPSTVLEPGMEYQSKTVHRFLVQ